MANYSLVKEVARPATNGTQVFIESTARGHWKVWDASGNRGGVFFDRDSATRFVRREFGVDAVSAR